MVTERQDSAELLTRLERENLFVIPLDQQGTWYRFHPLFADLLSHQLKARHPNRINQLHEKASRWFAEAAEFGEAVRHALAANNHEEAASILHEKYENILSKEGPGQLNRCLDNFSPGLLEKFPRLVVQKALYYLIYKGSKEAKPVLDSAEKLNYDNEIEQAEFTGMLNTLKAYYHIYKRELDRALEYAE